MSLRRHAETDEQEEALAFIEKLAEEAGIPLRYGTHVGKNPQSVVLDIQYQDGAIHVDADGNITGTAFLTEAEEADGEGSCDDINIRSVRDLMCVKRFNEVMQA